MTKDEVISLMRSSSSFEEWDNNADRVKRFNGGAYPAWWHEEITMSSVRGDFSRRMATRHNATVRAVYP